MANDVAVRTLAGEPITFSLPPGTTVADIVARTELPPEHLMVLNHGAVIEDWDYITKDGDSVALLLVPAGGSDGAKGVIGAIAMIAISFIAPVAGSVIAGSLGFGTASAAGYAATAFKLVAVLALSALVPPAPKAAQGEESKFFSGQSNVARPYGIVPRVYGRMRIAPALAANTILENIGTVSRIANLYDFGIGDLELTDIMVGDTLLSTLTNEVRQVYGAAPHSFHYMTALVGYQQFSFDMKDATPVHVSTRADAIAASVDIMFPAGLASITDRGNTVPLQVGFRTEYKLATSTTWLPIDGQWQGMTLIGGQPTGEMIVNGATRQSFVVNVFFNLPAAGKYDFRVTRLTPWIDDSKKLNTSILTLVKSWRESGDLVKSTAPHTLLEMRMVASEKISGNVTNLTAIATSKLRWFDSNLNEQAPAVTRNPAWIVLDILTGSANPRPLLLDQVDLASFRRLADFCDEVVTTNVGGAVTTGPRHLCDMIVESETTVAQLCSSILSCCRAQLLITQSGKYGVFIDKEQSVSRQLFTPDNSWNFSGNRTFIDIPHGIRVSFIDPDANWSKSEVIAYADGYSASNATVFEELDTVGMTRGASAWRYARYMMAQGIHRSEVLELTVDAENIAVQRGEKVSVAHDVPKIGGMSARIVKMTGSSALIDQPTDTPYTHYTVRRSDGTLVSGTTTYTDGENWTLSSATGVAYDDLIVLGYADRVTKDYLITEIAPGEDLTATLRMVAYVPEVYTADEGAIPPWNPGFGDDGVSGGFKVKVTAVSASQSISYPERKPLVAVSLTWTASGPLGAVAEYQISASRNGGQFEQVGTSTDTRFIQYIDPRNSPQLMVPTVYRVTPISKLGVVGEHGEASITPAGDVTSSPDWNSSQPLSEVSWQTTHTSVGARTGTYMIRAVDISGNVSAPLFRRTTVETLPDINEIKILDDTTPGYPGQLSGLTKSGTTLVTAAGKDGTYTFAQTVDLADVFEVRISSKIVAKAINTVTRAASDASIADWDVWLEVRSISVANMMSSWTTLSSINPISQGNAPWGDWRQVQVGDFTGRLFQFRIQCHAKASDVIVVIQDAKVIIDVPDRVWGVQDVAISTSGTRISFAPSFMEPPVIAVTIDGNSDDVFTRLSARDRTGVTVALVSSTTHTPVAGKVDIMAKGYGRKAPSAI